MFVSRKLHYCGSSYSPGYTSDFLGIPIDLGYQLRDFSVSVLTWKMGLRIREILIARLVAITLMIAESRPEEKDIMVNLVMNFLTM